MFPGRPWLQLVEVVKKRVEDARKQRGAGEKPVLRTEEEHLRQYMMETQKSQQAHIDVIDLSD